MRSVTRGSLGTKGQPPKLNCWGVHEDARRTARHEILCRRLGDHEPVAGQHDARMERAAEISIDWRQSHEVQMGRRECAAMDCCVPGGVLGSIYESSMRARRGFWRIMFRESRIRRRSKLAADFTADSGSWPNPSSRNACLCCPYHHGFRLTTSCLDRPSAA